MDHLESTRYFRVFAHPWSTALLILQATSAGLESVPLVTSYHPKYLGSSRVQTYSISHPNHPISVGKHLFEDRGWTRCTCVFLSVPKKKSGNLIINPIRISADLKKVLWEVPSFYRCDGGRSAEVPGGHRTPARNSRRSRIWQNDGWPFQEGTRRYIFLGTPFWNNRSW